MPYGFRAQDGPRPEFAELYGIQEHASDRYPPRTALNVKESDATICFASDWDSPGEVLTRHLCDRYGRPRLEVTRGGTTSPVEVVAWLRGHDVRVLNVAGNSERTSPGIKAFVTAFLAEVFALMRDAPG